MKNKIVSTIALLILTTLILSSCLYFVKAEDNVVTNETQNNEENQNNTVNTLSLNEQKEQVEQELQKAEEQLKERQRNAKRVEKN